jgi:hypothetical protein
LLQFVGVDALVVAELLVVAPALHRSALRFSLSDADEAMMVRAFSEV